MWTPSSEPASAPRYRSIALALARDIAEGRIRPGTRLPTQRALATALGVTVGTVGRAYAEAQRLGLVSGEVGRGTFVRTPQQTPPFGLSELDPSEHDDYVDMSLNFPSAGGMGDVLREALVELAGRPDLAALLSYQLPAGTERHRGAGATWVSAMGLETTPEQIVVTTGAQHAMSVAFSSLCQPGDVIASEALTYPGMTALARLLRLRLVPVALDAYGARPEAFDAVCRSHAPRALYCMPALHNPTAAVMPEARRREIAEIARRHDVALVEDDIHGFLTREPTPRLSSFAPERSYYVTSLSKCVAPGLRIGYLRAPADQRERVAACLRSMMWMAPPITAEIATLWLETGVARRLVDERRREARARNTLVRRSLRTASFSQIQESQHVWLRLPEPWRATEFTEQARRRRVLVAPAESFCVGREPPPHAVRLSIAAPSTRSALEKGLGVVADLLSGAPEPVGSMI